MSAVDPFHGTLVYSIPGTGRRLAKLKFGLADAPVS
jgi:hypothetical protein